MYIVHITIYSLHYSHLLRKRKPIEKNNSRFSLREEASHIPCRDAFRIATSPRYLSDVSVLRSWGAIQGRKTQSGNLLWVPQFQFQNEKFVNFGDQDIWLGRRISPIEEFLYRSPEKKQKSFFQRRGCQQPSMMLSQIFSIAVSLWKRQEFFCSKRSKFQRCILRMTTFRSLANVLFMKYGLYMIQ